LRCPSSGTGGTRAGTALRGRRAHGGCGTGVQCGRAPARRPRRHAVCQRRAGVRDRRACSVRRTASSQRAHRRRPARHGPGASRMAGTQHLGAESCGNTLPWSSRALRNCERFARTEPVGLLGAMGCGRVKAQTLRAGWSDASSTSRSHERNSTWWCYARSSRGSPALALGCTVTSCPAGSSSSPNTPAGLVHFLLGMAAVDRLPESSPLCFERQAVRHHRTSAVEVRRSVSQKSADSALESMGPRETRPVNFLNTARS
jgi:hypothetical protein